MKQIFKKTQVQLEEEHQKQILALKTEHDHFLRTTTDKLVQEHKIEAIHHHNASTYLLPLDCKLEAQIRRQASHARKVVRGQSAEIKTRI